MRSLIAVVMIVLTGCATQELVVHEYETSGRPFYPSISVLVNDGYVRTSSGCYSGAGCHTYVDATSKFTIDELRASGLFERVDTNNASARYKLFIHVDRKPRESEAVQFMKVMVSAGSLLVIPMVHKNHYVATFELVDGETLLARFDYDVPVDEEWNLLMPHLDVYKKGAMKSLVSGFLKDLEQHDVFDAPA